MLLVLTALYYSFFLKQKLRELLLEYKLNNISNKFVRRFCEILNIKNLSLL